MKKVILLIGLFFVLTSAYSQIFFTKQLLSDTVSGLLRDSLYINSDILLQTGENIIPSATGLVDGINISDSIDQSVTSGSSPTFAGINVDGAAVFNESGADVDFRIEAAGEIAMFFVDASAKRLGSGTIVPSGTFHLKTIAVTDIILETTSNSSDVHFTLFNNTDNVDKFFFKNFCTSSASQSFGIDNTNLGILAKSGDGNLVIGTEGSGFVVLGANDTEVVRIDSTPLVTITGDALVTQHMAAGASAAINTLKLFHLKETLVSFDGFNFGYGIHNEPTFTSDAVSDALFGIDVAATINGSDGGTIRALRIVANSDITAGANVLIGGSFKIATDGSANAPSTAQGVLIEVPAISGTKPSSLQGIQIDNQGISGITTSEAINIENQTGSTTNFAIKTGTGFVEFGDSLRVLGATVLDNNAANTSAIVTFENTAGDVQLFRTDATPESTVTGSIGDIAIDGTGGMFYFKASGSANNTGWQAIGGTPTYKSYSLSNPGNSGTFYIGGHYAFAAADANLTIGGTVIQTFGTAGQAHGSHAFAVASGAGGTDLVLTVTGVSITEAGARNDADTEILIADADAAITDQYFETSKKWLGQITYTLTGASGTFDFNYGFVKYEDFGNEDFTVTDFEGTGEARANETGLNIELLHHEPTAFIYHASAFVPNQTALISLATDYGTNNDVANGDGFAYKRTGLTTSVNADNGEGLIIRVTTVVNNSINDASFHIGVTLK